MSHETRHSASSNIGTIVDDKSRGGYRSQTSHYSFHNHGESGRLLTFSGYNVGSDGRVGYRSQTSHYSYQVGDSMGEVAKYISRTKDINHSLLFNFV